MTTTSLFSSGRFIFYGSLCLFGSTSQSGDTPSTPDQGDEGIVDSAIEAHDRHDFSDMASYSIDFDHWLKEGTSKGKIHQLQKPRVEPGKRGNKASNILM